MGWWRSEGKQKGSENVLAVSAEPRVKVVVAEGKDKSKLIRNMTLLMKRMTEDPDFDLADILSDTDKQLEIDFVPEEDEEIPDLEIDDLEGPEIKEEDMPGDKAINEISIGELVGAND